MNERKTTLTVVVNALRARGYGFGYLDGALRCVDAAGTEADKGIANFLSGYTHDEIRQALSTPYMLASGEVIVTLAWKGAPVMVETATRH